MIDTGDIIEKSPTDMEQAWYNLANAIIERACEDYIKALLLMDTKRLIDLESNYKTYPHILADECERFFSSEYFQLLTRVDGTYIMERIRKELNYERKDNKYNN